jgi:MYXO-CTERM domain-containing protein
VPNLVGACAAGVTACGPGGVITCSPRIEPTAEVCDNVDNNCDGMVDNDPMLCVAENKVCYQGKCVPRCNTGEFQCQTGEMCNAEGLCIDAACVGITCGEAQVCRGGVCVGACDGVVCPFTANGPQECQLGRCVNLCAASTCPEGTVCERGSCVRHCECRDCPENTACNRDDASPSAGQCVDTVCATMPCPAGEICYLGECRNPCDGAVCPGGAACNAGECGPPGTSGTGGGGGNTGGTAGVIIAGTSSGATTGNGGSSAASGGNGSGDDDEGTLGSTPTGNPGCACRAVGSRDTSGLMTLLAAVVAGALGMRRRRQRA